VRLIALQSGEKNYGDPKMKVSILELQRLVDVLKDLPRLQEFYCEDFISQPSNLQMLSDLPSVAPNLQVLVLENNGLAGQLPSTWGNWPAVKHIFLGNNAITGTISDSFSALARLAILQLSLNKLNGTLPDMWGRAQIMPKSLIFSLSDNPGIRGQVPSSWAHFSKGMLFVDGTRVTGCLPDGLLVVHQHALPTCLRVSSDGAAL
jgi:hypothetical protein